jgi:hypothetical protein
MALNEDDLSDQFVRPLVEVLHPGRVEYTHSSDEAGRDFVSFGRDSLGREHILCVQVKARPISHGAAGFGAVSQVATIAKTQGVTRENGDVCVPSEVWFVTSHPFPEHKRRQVSGVLQELAQKNIKFVPGEELANLIVHKLPRLAAALAKVASPRAFNFIASLLKHHEGRAFGLSQDRDLTEFYVTAALSSNTLLANAAVRRCVSLGDHCENLELPLLNLIHLDELHLPCPRLRELIAMRTLRRAVTIPEAVPHIVISANASEVLAEARCEIAAANKEVQSLPHDAVTVSHKEERVSRKVGNQLALQFELSKVTLSPVLTYKTSRLFKQLVREARSALHQCPGKLTKDVRFVRTAVERLRCIEALVRWVSEVLDRSVLDKFAEAADPTTEVLRLQVPYPEHLLGISKVLLVEGPPGCGKTTLLKILAIRLANLDRSVAYLPCGEIPPEHKKATLVDLVREFGRASALPRVPLSKTVLVVDGLDEAGFDLSKQVEEGRNDFSNIVVSCRSAFATELRSHFPQMTLSQFTDGERSEFFKRWFSQKPELVQRARELVAEHRDLEVHTRLPLIATIMVALLENGIEPKTRAEVYGMRLDLLLSRWDKFRGVRRLAFDVPEAKRRFLRNLAYKIHSMPGRRRFMTADDLLKVYEDSLGKWGYDREFAMVLRDLVLGSGVLVEERPGVYSFGHLTFQEHLAGEYLALHCRVEDVGDRVNDDWWREPLNFYASIKGDITEFIDCLLQRDSFAAVSEQLRGMIQYAPFTSPGAVDAFAFDRRQSSAEALGEE